MGNGKVHYDMVEWLTHSSVKCLGRGGYGLQTGRLSRMVGAPICFARPHRSVISYVKTYSIQNYLNRIPYKISKMHSNKRKCETAKKLISELPVGLEHLFIGDKITWQISERKSEFYILYLKGNRYMRDFEASKSEKKNTALA